MSKLLETPTFSVIVLNFNGKRFVNESLASGRRARLAIAALYEYPQYMQPEAWREPNLSHPHNIVLDFWVRMGVPGLVALAWLLFEFYRRGIRGVRAGRGDRRALIVGLLAGLTAGLAHGMIDAAYFYVDLAFVFMLMLAVTVSESKDKERMPF